MISQKRISIYTQLANKYNLPYQVIEVICNHPFKFASNIISNDTDNKSIMFSYLFKLKLKRKNADKKRGESESRI
nr:MAG TPA: hypothetical protein [Caudoviricetes sp.]